MDAHEDPYIVTGTRDRSSRVTRSASNPASTCRAWGMRLEDIVVATADGPDPLNSSEHSLVPVDA